MEKPITRTIAEGQQLIAAARKYKRAFRVDSELLARQVSGMYKVKAPTLKPLIIELMSLLSRIPSWSVTHVRRELNMEADALVNRAIDERGVVE